MTSNEIVPIFAQHTASALKEAPEVDQSQFNSLQVKAMDMMSGVTSLTPAVQDIFQGECRTSTFDGMPQIVTGKGISRGRCQGRPGDLPRKLNNCQFKAGDVMAFRLWLFTKNRVRIWEQISIKTKSRCSFFWFRRSPSWQFSYTIHLYRTF